MCMYSVRRNRSHNDALADGGGDRVNRYIGVYMHICGVYMYAYSAWRTGYPGSTRVVSPTNPVTLHGLRVSPKTLRPLHVTNYKVSFVSEVAQVNPKILRPLRVTDSTVSFVSEVAQVRVNRMAHTGVEG